MILIFVFLKRVSGISETGGSLRAGSCPSLSRGVRGGGALWEEGHASPSIWAQGKGGDWSPATAWPWL